MKNDQWFISTIAKDDDQFKNKLFLFPHAGGGASTYRNWQENFCDTKLYCAQYPGRENRITEEPIKNMDQLIGTLAEEIAPLVKDGTPYYFFGHSLGTKVIYELALKIQEMGCPKVSGLIVSAGRAPCFKEPNPIFHLEDQAFITSLKRFSGTPDALLENRDLMKLFIPMLRADFELDERYQRKEVVSLNCPIMGLMGSDDKELTIDELKKWREYSTDDFAYEIINGGHMFVSTNSTKVIDTVKTFIE